MTLEVTVQHVDQAVPQVPHVHWERRFSRLFWLWKQKSWGAEVSGQVQWLIKTGVWLPQQDIKRLCEVM